MSGNQSLICVLTSLIDSFLSDVISLITSKYHPCKNTRTTLTLLSHWWRRGLSKIVCTWINISHECKWMMFWYKLISFLHTFYGNITQICNWWIVRGKSYRCIIQYSMWHEWVTFNTVNSFGKLRHLMMGGWGRNVLRKGKRRGKNKYTCIVDWNVLLSVKVIVMQ